MNTVLVRYGHSLRTKQYTNKKPLKTVWPDCKANSKLKRIG